jgi:uncharacterized protein YlzI (FlbEa/FlbD family)
MSKEELEAFWNRIIELDKSVGLKASIMDDVYDKIMQYARQKGIDVEELDIKY